MGATLSTLKQASFFGLAAFHMYCVYKMSLPGSSLFSWHPFLTSAAFGLIMPEAFTQISRLSEFGKRFSHKTRVTMHWVLQTVSLLFAGIGLYCIYANKVQANKPHLQSYHAILGFATFLYAVLQSLGGVLLLYPNLKPKSAPSTTDLKIYHTVSSAALMLGASGTFVLANQSNWYLKHKLNNSVYATGLFVYPAVLAGRAVYNVYETGAFGKLLGKGKKPAVANGKD